MNISIRLTAVIISCLALIDDAGANTAEIPPPGYDRTTFVDSRGCIYALSDLDGWDVWVQRLDADRQPICDREPTRFPAETEAGAVDAEERT